MIPAALGAVVALDALIAVSHLHFPLLGFLDDPAHAATGLIVLAAWGRVRVPGPLLAFWCGAVAIDLDHLTLLAGWDGFSRGTGRPYSHSLATVAIAGIVAFVVPRWRRLAIAFIIGLLTHFSRDLATGDGVALLWPLDYHQFTVPYALWLGSLTALAGWAYTMGPESKRSARLVGIGDDTMVGGNGSGTRHVRGHHRSGLRR
jgi:inner membrane protein